jgi:hypothetical protein
MSETAQKYFKDQAAAIGRYLRKDEVAALFRVNPATIMVWVEKGLLSPPFRPTTNGPLFFDAAQLDADVQRWKAPVAREAPVPKRIRLRDDPEAA